MMHGFAKQDIEPLHTVNGRTAFLYYVLYRLCQFRRDALVGVEIEYPLRLRLREREVTLAGEALVRHGVRNKACALRLRDSLRTIRAARVNDENLIGKICTRHAVCDMLFFVFGEYHHCQPFSHAHAHTSYRYLSFILRYKQGLRNLYPHLFPTEGDTIAVHLLHTARAEGSGVVALGDLLQSFLRLGCELFLAVGGLEF